MGVRRNRGQNSLWNQPHVLKKNDQNIQIRSHLKNYISMFLPKKVNCFYVSIAQISMCKRSDLDPNYHVFCSLQWHLALSFQITFISNQDEWYTIISSFHSHDLISEFATCLESRPDYWLTNLYDKSVQNHIILTIQSPSCLMVERWNFMWTILFILWRLGSVHNIIIIIIIMNLFS